MATGYDHGVRATLGATQAQNAIQAGTVPVYIGTAPVHLVRGWKDKGLVNSPVKLTDYKQALQAIGYSNDWGAYTLCEAVTAHFNNPLGNIGPIYIINTLDPDTHFATGTGGAIAEETATITFVNKRAEIATTDIILDTLTLADKAEGVDYAVDYDYNAGKVIITALNAELATATAKYNKVDPAAVDASDIVGGETAGGEYSGIGALPLLYIKENQVATLLAAPGWSHDPAVHNALVTAAQKMNGHWLAYVYTDIPLDEAGTIEDAITWKQTNGYNSQFETVCWPQVIDNTGKAFHLSTLSVWRQMLVNNENDGIPFETASNKAVPGIKQYFGAESKNAGFDKDRGNRLNEKGIRTVVPSNGNLVLWGGHTAAFTYGATSDALPIFDTNVMMQGHLCNWLQRNFEPDADKPMTPQFKDFILETVQDKLDSYVAKGALLGEPKINFLASENSTADMLNGEFKFSLYDTPTPQAKLIEFSVVYTDDGFSALLATE